MGCSYKWADESHLIMDMSIEAPWTLDEFMAQAQETFSIIKALGTPCATAVDVTKIGGMPKGNILRYLTEIENMMPANVFASGLIGAPYMISVFMDIIMKMRPNAQRIAFFAKTREEAHQKIRERYAILQKTT